MISTATRLFIFGGELSGRALSEVQRFDPWTDCWEQLPSMRAGRVRAGAAECDGKLYVLGGLDGGRPLKSAERYDLQRGVWEELPPMHRPRYACAAAACGDLVFAFGGDMPLTGAPATVECFDPAKGCWELLPGIQPPACGSAVVLADGGRTAFTMGGLGLSGHALGLARCLSLGEPEGPSSENSPPAQTMAWCPLPAMPTPRHLVSAAPLGDGVVAVGGKGATFQASCEVELFRPQVAEWETLPPLPHARIRAAVVGGRL